MGVVNLTEENKKNPDFAQQLEAECGERVSLCYQCGKCSAGCPVAFAMDLRPNRIIRLIQLGMKDQVLNSRSIWMCATCSTCTTRCPRNVDLSKINDALRIMARREGILGGTKDELAFHQIFMDSIAKHGRVYELGLVLALKLKTGNYFQDAELGLPMFLKGKLALLPPKMQGSKEVKQIIEASKRLEGDK